MPCALATTPAFTADAAVQVVPQGAARIRTQISAAHTEEEVDRCVAAFVEVGKEMGVIE
jgi:7-keto-8-aminopelargonate synthetase-like enzyme